MVSRLQPTGQAGRRLTIMRQRGLVGKACALPRLPAPLVEFLRKIYDARNTQAALMALYPLTWVTRNLAVGHAPLSYAELDSLREQGIDAIVNLCDEFTDLHQIEEKSGFEVFWLPVEDEKAPEMAAMEKGLEWLDEAVYLGKKVLVHCRHGIGRTGTFVTAYLLRRGFSLKNAGKRMKVTRANPTNFSQWWLLRKFGKKEGRLTTCEPTPENRNGVDLSEFYRRYESLLKKIDDLAAAAEEAGCANDGGQPCSGTAPLELIEALYLNNRVNIDLSAAQRQEVINLAKEIDRGPAGDKQAAELPNETSPVPAPEQRCPLQQQKACLLYQARPSHCRMHGFGPAAAAMAEINRDLAGLSREVFSALFGQESSQPPPLVGFSESISGKFIQRYFQYLTARKSTDERSSSR